MEDHENYIVVTGLCCKLSMKKILLYLQSVFYIVAGINHFRNPEIYYTLIPPYFPSHPTINIIAGIAEIVLGIFLCSTAHVNGPPMALF
jgi:uncharacterized membrane protein